MIPLDMAPKANPLGVSLDDAERELAEVMAANHARYENGMTPEKMRRRILAQKKAAERREEKREDDLMKSRLAEIRHRAILAALHRHGLDPKKIPSMVISLLFNTPVGEWFEQAHERQVIRGALGLSLICADAAMQNEDILAYIAEGHLKESEVRDHPPVMVEFEEAGVIGSVGTGFSVADGKSWGRFLDVKPIEPTTIIYRMNVGIYYKSGSRYNARFEQRKWMKHKLGRGYRKLVGHAKRLSKTDFLKQFDNGAFGLENAAKVVQARIGVDMPTFWRAAKGAVIIPKPAIPGLLPFMSQEDFE